MEFMIFTIQAEREGCDFHPLWPGRYKIPRNRCIKLARDHSERSATAIGLRISGIGAYICGG
jgi:hypothetical protein